MTHSETSALDVPHPSCMSDAEWAAARMSDYAAWAGRWAGCSDILARLVARLPDDDDTRAALSGYRQLRERFENRKERKPGA